MQRRKTAQVLTRKRIAQGAPVKGSGKKSHQEKQQEQHLGQVLQRDLLLRRAALAPVPSARLACQAAAAASAGHLLIQDVPAAACRRALQHLPAHARMLASGTTNTWTPCLQAQARARLVCMQMRHHYQAA